MNKKSKALVDIDPRLNSFAIRSFRDTADYDYINARLAWRGRLIPQFHWAALQSIEKYLKCVLMLNRVPRDPKDRLSHDLGKALARVEKNLTFPIRLSASSRELIEHLDKFGRFRYLEVSYYARGLEVLQLDQAVWELRRYCQWLNTTLKLDDGKVINLQPLLLKSFESAEAAPHKFRLIGGQVEKILADPSHPAREALVWRNMYFGSRTRKQVRIRSYSPSTNAPLAMDPDLLDEVLKYVEVPSAVATAYRTSQAARKQNRPD